MVLANMALGARWGFIKAEYGANGGGDIHYLGRGPPRLRYLNGAGLSLMALSYPRANYIRHDY